MTKVFAIYDSKAEAYGKPFHYNSRGEAIRGFQEALKDEKTTFAKYPADFTMFEIGEYDELTAELTPYAAKIALGNGIELKQ